MSKLTPVLTLMILALCASTAQADSGFGVKCSMFVSGEPHYKTLLFMWAEGFMEGINFEIGVETHETANMQGLDNMTQMRFLNNYCMQHPDDLFGKAATSLLKQFPYGGKF